MSESAIHDLGYKRYGGARQEASRRWRVIARHQIASGWKGFWRYKFWLILAAIVVAVAAGFIFIGSTKLTHINRGTTSFATTLADFAMSMTYSWCGRIAFIVSLCIGASVIAGDNKSGAFVFYFARSTRPIDYLVGKIVGYSALVAVIYIGGPFLVALMRLGLTGSDDMSQLIHDVWLVPETLVIGVIGTIVYTIMPLAFSALVPNRRYTIGIWASWYMVVGFILSGIGVVTHSPVAALDITTALSSLIGHMPHMKTVDLFGLPVWVCVLSLAAQTLLGVGFIYMQLRSAQQSGVGGAT